MVSSSRFFSHQGCLIGKIKFSIEDLKIGFPSDNYLKKNLHLNPIDSFMDHPGSQINFDD